MGGRKWEERKERGTEELKQKKQSSEFVVAERQSMPEVRRIYERPDNVVELPGTVMFAKVKRNKKKNGIRRPAFSSRFQRSLPVGRKQARRHIVSFEVMKSAFQRVLEAGDADFGMEARLFLIRHGRTLTGGSNIELANECLRILNENKKNFIVDTSSVNSAIGVVGFRIQKALQSKVYESWPDGISCVEAIRAIITPRKGSSVSLVVEEIEKAFRGSVLNNNIEKEDFLSMIYDNMNFDIMNQHFNLEQKIRMKNMFEKFIYYDFIEAKDTVSLFRVCDKFMNL